MNLSVKYNGYDITGSVDLESCILCDRYGGLLDSIKLVINNADGQWSKAIVSKGDEIIIKTDSYSTGSMYVANFESMDNKVVIDAVSLKQTNRIVKSKVWSNVLLTEILNDCAKNNGLTLKTYGIVDYSYDTLAQIHKTDLEFACMVCKREGYSVKVDDNCLIVFNEQYMESQNAGLTIKAEDVSTPYRFVRSSECVHSVTISHYHHEQGLIEQTATDDELLGSSKIINEKVSSYDEAMRFARGYLRDFNKKSVVGHLAMPYNPKISAGTLINAEGFNEFDGKYVVIEILNDIKRETTRLTARKVLGY